MSSEKKEERLLRRINLIAVAAGAFASISAAVLASYLGVAGTLIGAALASVVSSVAGAVYTGLLASTRERIQRGLRRTAGQDSQLRELGELRERTGRLSLAGRLARSWPSWLRRPATRWLVVGAAALLMFAIAIGAVTGIEMLIRKPLASALGGHNEGSARTSVGAAMRGSSSQQPAGQQRQPSSSTTQSGGSGGSGGSGSSIPSQSTSTRQTGPPASSTTSPAPSTSGVLPSTTPSGQPPPSTR